MPTMRISFSLNGIDFSYLLVLWVLFAYQGFYYSILPLAIHPARI